MRLFHGDIVGQLYTLLRSRVYRRGVSSLKFSNVDGYLTQLALRYDAGKLCSYYTDTEIMEALGGYTDRSIANARKTLEDLKLIKTEKHSKSGYFYELGVRPRVQTEDGYDTGAEAESFYIDSWQTRSLVEDSEEHRKFRTWLVEKLAPPALKAKLLDNLRKIFRTPAKNISENDTPVGTYIVAPAQVKTDVAKTSIEDNTYIKSKDTSGDLFEEKEIDRIKERDLQISRLTNDILQSDVSDRTNVPKILEIAEQLRVTLGVNSHEVGSLLTGKVPYSKLFASLPRFSLSFLHRPKKEIEKDTLSRVYSNLMLDIHGTPENIVISRVTMGKALENYSFAQLVWTFKHVASTDKESLYFLAKGVTRFESVVKKFSNRYQAELVFTQQQEESLARTVLAQKQADIYKLSASEQLALLAQKGNK